MCRQDGEKDDLQRVNAANTESKQLNGCWNPRERREGFTDGCGSATHAGSKRLQGSEWLGSYEQRQAAHGSVTERNHAWDEPWIEAATRLCRMDDGLPRRVDRVNRLKALGNSIVPQVAYEIMEAIVAVEGNDEYDDWTRQDKESSHALLQPFLPARDHEEYGTLSLLS